MPVSTAGLGPVPQLPAPCTLTAGNPRLDDLTWLGDVVFVLKNAGNWADPFAWRPEHGIEPLRHYLSKQYNVTQAELERLDWDGELLVLDLKTPVDTKTVTLRALTDPAKRKITDRFSTWKNTEPKHRTTMIRYDDAFIAVLLDLLPVQRCVEAYVEHNETTRGINPVRVATLLWEKVEKGSPLPLLEGAQLETFVSLGMSDWDGPVAELHAAAIRLAS